MTEPPDDSLQSKMALRRKALLRKKEELDKVIRLLEEYQKLACQWDPNAPRPAEPDTPGANSSRRAPGSPRFGSRKT